MKWYAYVIIALLLLALGFSIRGCRQAEHDDQVTNLAAIDMMVEHKAKIDSMADIIASQAHDLDSARQSHTRTQGPVKSNIKTWKERIDPVERIAVLINGKNTGDTTVYFTSKEEALRYLYDQMVARDTTIYWQDSLIRDMETERATVKVKTDELVNSIKAKARLSEDEVSKWIGRYQESEATRAQDSKDFRRQRRRERIAEGVIIVGVIILAI